MADATDLKSVISNGVRVRVPPTLIQKNTKKYIDILNLI